LRDHRRADDQIDGAVINGALIIGAPMIRPSAHVIIGAPLI